MKKKFRMQGLDCANCAAKMENSIKKIAGVNSVSVNFITQKLVIDAQDSAFEAIMEEAQKICSKIEPDCKIVL